MNVDPNINITTSTNGYYLKREVFPWEDVIRLNFDDFENNQILKEQVESYVGAIIDHFDGFRVDNLHNTHPEA